jgi:dsDNA-specific endonuclease/ATPase MutS2
MINKDTLRSLEFEKVLSIASSVLKIHPLDNRKDIEKRLGEIKDIRRLTQDGTPLALTAFEDITGLLESLRPRDRTA